METLFDVKTQGANTAQVGWSGRFRTADVAKGVSSDMVLVARASSTQQVQEASVRAHRFLQERPHDETRVGVLVVVARVADERSARVAAHCYALAQPKTESELTKVDGPNFDAKTHEG